MTIASRLAFSTVLLTLPGVALAQVQSAGQQACATGIEAAFAKMVKTSGKELSKCLKDIAASKSSVSGCLGADRKGKVAKAEAAIESSYADNCLGARPDFAFGGAGAAVPAARTSDDDLIALLFGDDPGSALPSGAPDEALAACQQTVTKALLKCHDTRLKTFTSCNRDALATAADASATAACIGADTKGKVAKACDLDEGGSVDKLRSAIASCGAVDLADAFPGCDTSDAAALHACLAGGEACQACLALGDVTRTGGAADCDTIDDGLANRSCVGVTWSNSIVPSGAEPADTPGSPGVIVTHPQMLTQFDGVGPDLNSSMVTRWRLAGPEQQPGAILVVIAGFGGGANNFSLLARDLIPRALDDHDLVLEVWAVTRRSEQLEDREGSLLALEAADEAAARDWYYGGAMALPMTALITSGPARRAEFYDSSSDIPFLANWTTHVFSQDLDAVVEAAHTVVADGNVFLGGHSAGTGFTARYAATDFDATGMGPAEPGYGKLRGLVLFEGGGGSTAGGALTADTLDRIEAKFDGGLFGAVRDNAARCVDGTTPCTIATEAADCVGQVPPKCTEPVAAYSAVGGLGPEVSAAAEPTAIQGLTDPDRGLGVLQQDTAGSGTAAVDLVPALSLLGFLADSTVEGLFGQYLDDDGLGASLSAAVATGLGELGGGSPRRWRDITEGPFAAATIPDNGAAPTTPPAVVWGQEKELVSMSRFRTTFTAADNNASDWYYASSGLGVTSVSGRCSSGTCSVGNVGAGCSTNSDCSQSISLDSSALSIGRGRRDIVNLTQAPAIDIPVICFGGSNGLTPIGASYLPFAQSIAACSSPSCDGTPRVVNATMPNTAFPTFGGIEGGFEVYIREGLAHNDVLVAEDGPDSDIVGPLAAFLARNAE